MKISIITPTFNSAKTILDTCISVTGQNYLNFEHIIIDNASEDETLSVIESHYRQAGLLEKLLIFSEKDRGISDAFNRGIQAATGDVVAILNSDDYYLDREIFKKACEIFKNENVLLVHGDIYFEDERYGSTIRKPLLCPIEKGMPFNHPTCFVRRELYNTYGLFDLNYKSAMDFEWFARFYVQNKPESYYYLKSNITHMRGYGESVSNEMRAIAEVKKGLMAHGHWNTQAKLEYLFRFFRVKTKTLLGRLNFYLPVYLWRKFKWRKR